MALDRSPRDYEYAHTEGLPPGVLTKDFKTGQIIHLAGSQAPYITVLLEGRAYLYSDMSDGHRAVLGLFNPVSLLGEELAREEGYKHTATAEAMEPSKVLTIDSAVLPQVLAYDADTARHLFQGVSNDTAYLRQRIQTLSKIPSVSKVADVLLDISQDGSNPLIHRPYTQAIIGDMSGTARMRVNQTIAKWRKLGILDGGMKGTILTPSGIHALRSIGEGMNDYQAAKESVTPARSVVTNLRDRRLEEHYRAALTKI